MSGSLASGAGGTPAPGPAGSDRLRAIARARFAAAADAPAAFFDHHAAALARACLDLAASFHHGGRLLVVGTGAAASDALHVSVEFVHPVIVGKRALPALALTESPADRLRVLAESDDMVLALVPHAAPEDCAEARRALTIARAIGAGTIAMVAAGSGGWDADHVFAVAAGDAFGVQEVHETAYHVLWELVHVFLDHPELLR